MFCGAQAGDDEDEEDADDSGEQKAEADREARIAELAGMDPDRVDAAVKKAVEFLKGQQQSDGSWKGGDFPPPGQQAPQGFNREIPWPDGLTALCLLALLKSGVDADDPCIKKGFDFLYQSWINKKRDWGQSGNYDASVLVLALAARYNPHTARKKKKEPDITKKKGLTEVYEPDETKQKKAFKKAPKQIRDWMRAAVNYIVKNQTGRGGFAYPATSGINGWTDNSNTQYALLALHAASQVGVKVSKNVFVKVASHFLDMQEKDGPEVKPFIVPAADFPIKKLKELQKRILDQAREDTKRQLEEGKSPEEIKKFRTAVLEDPYREYGVELDKIKMKARGWGYMPNGMIPEQFQVPADSIFFKVIGSMTTSGVAALVIAKANVEGTGWHNKKKKELDQSIRDGCAWLAHHFTVTENPNADEWHMYYLYGLERAGVLSLVVKLGDHNWYKTGAEYLIGNQQGDGSWPNETGQTKKYGPNFQSPAANLSNVTTTCFAVLFLKRATAAIVKLPGPIMTGEGFLKGGEKNEEEEK
jgi:hypothetical protein